MSNAILTAKTPGNWAQLNKQLSQAKALMREMRRTVEDIEDARTIERAKRRQRQQGAHPLGASQKSIAVGLVWQNRFIPTPI